MGAVPEIVVEPTADQLADDVAARLVATLVSALSVRPLAYLVVTGGGILEQTMAALRRLAARDSVDWRRVSVWWGDERFVAADSPDRNDRAAFAALFDALPLDPANVHRMPAAGAAFGEDAEAAADAYATELAAAVLEQHDGDVPHFDAVLLGTGPDLADVPRPRSCQRDLVRRGGRVQGTRRGASARRRGPRTGARGRSARP